MSGRREASASLESDDIKYKTRSATFKQSRLEAANVIASKRTLSKSATETAPILTGADATTFFNLIFLLLLICLFAVIIFMLNFSPFLMLSLANFGVPYLRKIFNSLQTMLTTSFKNGSSRAYITLIK